MAAAASRSIVASNAATSPARCPPRRWSSALTLSRSFSRSDILPRAARFAAASSVDFRKCVVGALDLSARVRDRSRRCRACGPPIHAGSSPTARSISRNTVCSRPMRSAGDSAIEAAAANCSTSSASVGGGSGGGGGCRQRRAQGQIESRDADADAQLRDHLVEHVRALRALRRCDSRNARRASRRASAGPVRPWRAARADPRSWQPR